MDKMIESSKQVSLFCRLNLNTRRDLPIRSSEMGMLIYLVKTDEVKTPHAAPNSFMLQKPWQRTWLHPCHPRDTSRKDN